MDWETLATGVTGLVTLIVGAFWGKRKRHRDAHDADHCENHHDQDDRPTPKPARGPRRR